MTHDSKQAIILLSGGLDSTTTLAVAKRAGFVLYALSFFYGQKNQFELQSAREIAGVYGVQDHKVIDIDLRAFGGSSLTTDMPVEKNRTREQIGRGIPATYVPARNTLFLSYALAWAEVLGISDIFIGVNAVDSSGYPDCRPEYIAAFSRLANLATRLGTEEKKTFTIHTPLIELSKAQIIQLGLSLDVDYSKTSSCYDPDPSGSACGRCDSCTLRQLGFFELSLRDPLPYLNPLQPLSTADVSR